MSGFSALPALDIDPAAHANAAAQQTLGTMSALQAYQAQQQLQPDAIAAKKAALQEESQLPALDLAQKKLALTAAQNRSTLDQADIGNALLAQVAKDASAADPQDAPAIWDAGMKKAADQGITTANQYIGHYRPDLAERVGDVYGGQGVGGKGSAGSPLAPSQADTVAINRAVAQIPPEQAAKALGNLNKAIGSFNNVKDQQSWDAEMQALKESGIDVSQFLPNMDWTPVNYATAFRMIQKLAPYRDALAQRQAITAMGGVAPATTPLYAPDMSISGYDKQGHPIYYDKHNPGVEVTGANVVGPKPSAAAATFLLKQEAWLGVHPGDQAGALEFANGKRSMDPAQLQLQALNQANKELGEATLAGQQIDDPDAWVKARTQENFKLLTSAAQSPLVTGAKPGGATTPAGLPARALQAVKAAGGKPVPFNNGQVWKMAGGKPVRVK